MPEQFYTILTKIGKAKIANSTALGTKINLSKFYVGDGNGSYYSPTEDQTELKNKVWEGNISSIRVDEENPNWIILEAVIPGTDGGFMVREVGAIDEEGNLIAIGKFPETYKPIVGDGSIKDLILKMVLEVSNTSSVTLKIDPTVILATKKDINEINEKINNIQLVDTKVKLTDPDNLFEFEGGSNINQAILCNKTSILGNTKLANQALETANQAKQRGDEVKQKLVDKLISEGLNVSTSELFEELISKIELEKHNVPSWYDTHDKWYSPTELPDPRNASAQQTVNGKIYLIGGGNYSNSNTDTTFVYDPISNSWSQEVNMPTKRYSRCSSVVDNSIYVIGTYGSSTFNEAYDTLTKTWSTKEKVPTIRNSCTGSSVDNVIYVIGGNTSSSAGIANEAYNTLTNTWTTKSNMPTKRDFLSSATVNEYIYCIGGSVTSGGTNVNEVYNTITDTWTTKQPMPEQNYRFSLSKHGNYLYKFSGYYSNRNSYRYDISKDVWEQLSIIPNGLYDVSASVFDSFIYVMGGQNSGTSYRYNRCYAI